MSDLVRYSKIEKKLSLRFLKKKYRDSDNTILYDVGSSKHELINYCLLDDIKNLVIDSTKTAGVNIPNMQAENIFFSGYDNLGGITIPYNAMKINGRGYYFYWTESYPSKIKQINIITKDGIKTINVDNLKDFQINKRKYIASTTIIYEDNKKIMEYIIDKEEKIKEHKLTYFLNKDDVKNNSINMSDYIDYEEILVDINNDIRVKDIIVDKTCMQNLYKFYDAISYIHYDRLVIIDNDEMKLHPDKTIFYNNSIKHIDIFQDTNNVFYMVYKKEKIIYMENNKIKVIDIKKMYDENVVDINIYIEDHNGKHDPIIIIKYKNNKTKIITLNEEIEIDKLFNEFNLIYIDKYYSNKKEVKYYLENNDWYDILKDKKNIYYNKFFKNIYNDYLMFLDSIKDLHNKGFNYKAIRYLYENHFDNIINQENDNSYLLEMSNEEIDKFNELGSIYVKRKSLKK